MADHFAISVGLLEEVDAHRKALRAVYLDRVAPNRAQLIATKHDAIRQGIQAAKVHAALAEVQELRDLRCELGRFFASLAKPAVVHLP